MDVVGEIHGVLNGNEGSCFLFGKVKARQNHRSNIFFLLHLSRARLLIEPTAYRTPSAGRAHPHKELSDLVLENDDERQGSYTHNFIEDSPHEAHLEYLRDQNPNGHKGKQTHKDRFGTGAFEDAIGVVQKDGNKQHVYGIFEGEGEPE